MDIKTIHQLDDLIAKQVKDNSKKKYLLIDEIQDVDSWKNLSMVI